MSDTNCEFCNSGRTKFPFLSIRFIFCSCLHHHLFQGTPTKEPLPAHSCLTTAASACSLAGSLHAAFGHEPQNKEVGSDNPLLCHGQGNRYVHRAHKGSPRLVYFVLSSTQNKCWDLNNSLGFSPWGARCRFCQEMLFHERRLERAFEGHWVHPPYFLISFGFIIILY